MALKFRKKFLSFGDGRELNAREVVEAHIKEAPDYHDGELESLRRKQERMAGILAAVVDSLPDSQALEVIQSFGGYEEASNG